MITSTASVRKSSKLREFREAHGFTQAELGRRARIHPAVISQIEHGRTIPWASLKQRISRALEASVNDVFPE